MNFFDLHSDTLSRIYDENLKVNSNLLAVNSENLNIFKNTVTQFAVFLKGTEQNPENRFLSVLNNGITQLKSNNISIVKTADDLNISGHKCLLALEGGCFISSERDVENLYKLGVKTVSLTWNYDTFLAGGALEDGNLTDKGKEIIKALNKYNMVLDVSHLNRKSFFEAVLLAENVVATHSGLDAVTRHKRNLTDQQLDILKEKSGVVGIPFYPEFIGSDVFDGFFCTVDIFLEKGMLQNTAIGSDFDGADMGDELKTVADVLKLIEKTTEKYGKSVADKIFFENSNNFYTKVLTNHNL